jgi:hypothetical protein
MVKFRKRKTRDSNQVKFINDEIDMLLVKDDEFKNRLREYFDKMYNEESEKTATELDDSFDDNNK